MRLEGKVKTEEFVKLLKEALRRDELQERTYEIFKLSPKTDSKSYADAQKALKYDEEQFFTA